MKTTNSMNFQKDVIERSNDKTVIVMFTGDNCKSCKTMYPVIEKIDNSPINTFSIVLADVNKSPTLASNYNVRSLPTFLFFKKGNVSSSLVGARTAMQFGYDIFNKI